MGCCQLPKNTRSQFSQCCLDPAHPYPGPGEVPDVQVGQRAHPAQAGGTRGEVLGPDRRSDAEDDQDDEDGHQDAPHGGGRAVSASRDQVAVSASVPGLSQPQDCCSHRTGGALRRRLRTDRVSWTTARNSTITVRTISTAVRTSCIAVRTISTAVRTKVLQSALQVLLSALAVLQSAL